MSILVRLPSLFRALFPAAPSQVELEAATVDDLINALEAQWPGMRDRICDSTPAVRRHMNVFVDGQRATLATRLKPKSDVFVLTAISGG